MQGPGGFDPRLATLAATVAGSLAVWWLLSRRSVSKREGMVGEKAAQAASKPNPAPATQSKAGDPSAGNRPDGPSPQERHTATVAPAMAPAAAASSGKSRGVVAGLSSKDWSRPKQTAVDLRPTSRIQAARQNSKLPISRVRGQAAALRASGGQWRDLQFPPGDESLFRDPLNPPADWLRDGERGRVIQDAVVQWKGPESFCVTKRPLGKRWDGEPTWLYSDADSDGVASCLDVDGGEVCQGSLGDCYFLCALAACVRDMALADDLIDEEFEDVGIYGVSFWVDRRWEMVWVDRNFPCYRPAKASHSGRWRLVFASCEDPKEIWPVVVEKAYAKLHGSYEALTGGRIIEALCALTGGQGGALNLQSPLCSGEKVFAALRGTGELAAAGARFVGAGTLQELEEPHAKGIVSAHAYTVLDVYEDKASSLRLLKLRNPWNRGEWKGDWSDGSSSWHTDIGRRVAKAVAYESHEDGEFWMSDEDFIARFGTLDICDVSVEGREERLAALRAHLKEGVGQRGRAGQNVADDRDIDDLLAEIEGEAPSHKQRRKKHKNNK